MESKPIYQYRLDGIDVIEKLVFQAEVKPDDKFNFNVRTQSAIQKERKLVIIAIEININIVGQTKRLARFFIAYGFHVENFEDAYTTNETGQIIIPLEFENLLKSISLSTTRGVVYSELRGTALGKALMPVILMDTLKPEPGNMFEQNKPEKE